ncbi:unnamed protein product [Amoebophrya sp. A25]|nr:unnamed protein product [Amoebophrya sp. A25]|eukprot:GSA25T00008925001.1
MNTTNAGSLLASCGVGLEPLVLSQEVTPSIDAEPDAEGGSTTVKTDGHLLYTKESLHKLLEDFRSSSGQSSVVVHSNGEDVDHSPAGVEEVFCAICAITSTHMDEAELMPCKNRWICSDCAIDQQRRSRILALVSDINNSLKRARVCASREDDSHSEQPEPQSKKQRRSEDVDTGQTRITDVTRKSNKVLEDCPSRVEEPTSRQSHHHHHHHLQQAPHPERMLRLKAESSSTAAGAESILLKVGNKNKSPVEANEHTVVGGKREQRGKSKVKARVEMLSDPAEDVGALESSRRIESDTSLVRTKDPAFSVAAPQKNLAAPLLSLNEGIDNGSQPEIDKAAMLAQLRRGRGEPLQDTGGIPSPAEVVEAAKEEKANGGIFAQSEDLVLREQEPSSAPRPPEVENNMCPALDSLETSTEGEATNLEMSLRNRLLRSMARHAAQGQDEVDSDEEEDSEESSSDSEAYCEKDDPTYSLATKGHRMVEEEQRMDSEDSSSFDDV